MLLLPLTILSSITAASDLALYWGQASAGSEKSLGSYCETGAGDIYVISFINEFGGGRATSLNVAGHSGAISELSIPTIGNDIEKCQKLGKKVLLSLGGAAGTYGFNSNSNAEEVANELWNAFGGGHGINRPFGDVKIDGFDLDIENKQDAEQYVAFVDELRSLYAKDSSKSYYTSAAPQCPFPDASSGKAIAGAHMDFLFIQFYNNYCSLEGSNFNYDTWQNFASSSSPNPDVKLYVGLPGAKSAAGSGYVTIQEIKSKLSSFAGSANFGGFMAWDASQANQNTVNGETFAEQLVKLSGGSSPGPASSSSTTKAATSSSTSSSHSEAPTTSSPSSKVWWTSETSTSTSSAPSTSSSSSWTDTWWTPHAWWTPAASTSSKESSTESVSTSSSTSSSSSSVSTSTSPKSDSFSTSSAPTSTSSSTSNAPTSTTTSSTEWPATEASSSSNAAQITSSVPASTSSSKTTSVESSATTSPKSSSSSWSDTWWTPEASKSTSSVSSESTELSTEAPISASSSSSQVWWTPEASSTVERSTSTASSSTPKWSTKASTEPTTTSSSTQWWTPEATKPKSTHTSVTTSPSTWSSSSEPITSLYEVTSDGTIYVYQTTFNTVYTTVN